MAGFFFQDDVEPDPSELVGNKMTAAQSAEAAQRSHQVIQSLPSMDPEIVEPALRNLASDLDLTAGQLFGILRVAVTGQRVSPPLIESMEIVGKEQVLARIAKAARILEAPPGSQ